MGEIIMKLVSRFLLILVATPALAGQVIVNQGLSSADTFALRDQLAREHEWQEWLRFQQAIKWLEVLPVMPADRHRRDAWQFTLEVPHGRQP